MPAPRRRPTPRSPRWAIVVAAALVVVAGHGTPARGVVPEPGEPPPSPTLDRTLVDVASLLPGPDGAPRLLTVDPSRVDIEGETIRVALIEGGTPGWRTRTEQTLRFEDPDAFPLGTPWLVGLDHERFALLVPASTTEQTVVVALRVTPDAVIEETGRQVIHATIDDAGAADVDGDGSAELVLASAHTLRAGGTCQGSTVRTLSGVPDAGPAMHAIEGLRLAGGVLGQWDDRPGEDLLTYAYPNCPAGPDDPSRAVRVVVRLVDGAVVRVDDVGEDRLEGPPWLGPPARIDIDGTGPHEALAMTAAGLGVLDPGNGWAVTPLSDGLGFPIVLGPAAPGGGPTRVAWLDLGGPDAAATARVERAADGGIVVVPGHRPGATRDPRSDPVVIEAIGSLARGGGVWGWEGELVEAGCTVILVPGAASSCTSGDSERGPTWIGTRPLLSYGLPDQPRLVVAAGMAMNPENGYPATPAPWAAAPGGAWRHGPSAPFVLGDLDARSLTRADGSRAPQVAVADPIAREDTVRVIGPPGGRLFIIVHELYEGVTEPFLAPAWSSFVPVDEAGSQAIVLRLPVLEVGATAATSSVRVGLPGWDGPRRPGRWSLTIAAIDDRGTIARPVGMVIERDTEPPPLDVAVPFLSAVWPLEARLTGRSEPGSRITVIGIGAVGVETDGTFSVATPLAPWPQTLRLTARDPAGNETEAVVSVVGGVDYRQLPWVWILGVTLVLAAVISGLRGIRWRGGLDRPVAPGPGEDAGFELEELPPSTRLR